VRTFCRRRKSDPKQPMCVASPWTLKASELSVLAADSRLAAFPFPGPGEPSLPYSHSECPSMYSGRTLAGFTPASTVIAPRGSHPSASYWTSS